MAYNTKNRTGSVPPTDADHNYGGLYQPYGLGGNFSYPPKRMPSDNNPENAMNGIFMLAAFVVLFSFISFVFVICIYASLRRREYRGISLSRRINSSWGLGFSFAREDPLSLLNVGLDTRVIESLPVFEYKAQSFKDAQECAVCLSEFGENEKTRLLPNCKHSFHVECIDMWFRSHSTCPVCRTGAQPKQRMGNNNTDEISITLELISSGNREIRIVRGLEQGEKSSQEAKTGVDQRPSTSGISSMPETAIDMAGIPESEKQVCLHSGSQSSRTALHSLKRILSRGRDGSVFPDAKRDPGIETEEQSQS